jgi:hypothetical protein
VHQVTEVLPELVLQYVGSVSVIEEVVVPTGVAADEQWTSRRSFVQREPRPPAEPGIDCSVLCIGRSWRSS